MAKVKEVTAEFSIGGQVQVKKFDIQSTYEYRAAKTAVLEKDDDPDVVVIELTDSLKTLLEPQAQQDFEDLWDQRLASEN